MRDARGVLLVATVRGMRPIDDPWPSNFEARWVRSQRLGDGLVHAFSPTHERLRTVHHEAHTHRGWATFCAPMTSHNHLPGETCIVATEPITCVICASKI